MHANAFSLAVTLKIFGLKTVKITTQGPELKYSGDQDQDNINAPLMKCSWARY